MDHEDDVTDTMPPTTLSPHYVDDNNNNQPQHATDNEYQKGVTTNDME